MTLLLHQLRFERMLFRRNPSAAFFNFVLPLVLLLLVASVFADDDAELEVGALTESVTVTTEAALLKTDKADVSVDLRPEDVVNLPLNQYRNYQALMNLVPGATPPALQNAQGGDAPALIRIEPRAGGRGQHPHRRPELEPQPAHVRAGREQVPAGRVDRGVVDQVVERLDLRRCRCGSIVRYAESRACPHFHRVHNPVPECSLYRLRRPVRLLARLPARPSGVQEPVRPVRSLLCPRPQPRASYFPARLLRHWLRRLPKRRMMKVMQFQAAASRRHARTGRSGRRACAG